MTAPVRESTTATDFNSNPDGNHAANYPATVNAGDLLLLYAAMDGNTTISTPSGYTELKNASNGGDPAFVLYGKIAAGSEGGSTINVQTSNTQDGTVQIIRVSGWKGSLSDLITANKNMELGGFGQITPKAANMKRYLDYLYIMGWALSLSTILYGDSGGYDGTNLSGNSSSGAAQIRTSYKALSDIYGTFLDGIANNSSSSTGLPSIMIVIPQTYTGVISGNVSLDGNPVEAVNVYAMNQTTFEIYGPATTNASGDYSLPVPDTGDEYHVFTLLDDTTDYNALSLWGITPEAA